MGSTQPYDLVTNLAPGTGLSHVLDLLSSGDSMHALVRSCAKGASGGTGTTEVVTLDMNGKIKGRFAVGIKPTCTVNDLVSSGAYGALRMALLASGDIAVTGVNYEGDGAYRVQRYTPAGQLRWSVDLPNIDSYARAYALGAAGDEVWVAGALASQDSTTLGFKISYTDVDAGALFAFGIDASGALAHHVHVTQQPLVHLGGQGATSLRSDGVGGLWLLSDRRESAPSAALFHLKADGTVDVGRGTGQDGIAGTDQAMDVLPAPGDPKVFMYVRSGPPKALNMFSLSASGPKDTIAIPDIYLHARSSPTVMGASGPVFVGSTFGSNGGNDDEVSQQAAAIGYVTGSTPTVVSFPASHGSTFFAVAIDDRKRIWAGGSAGGRFRVGERESPFAPSSTGDAFIAVFKDTGAIDLAAKDNAKHPVPTCKATSDACAACMKAALCLTSCDRDGTCGPVLQHAKSCICDAQIDHPSDVSALAGACLDPVKQVGPNGNTASNCITVNCANDCM